MEIEARARRTLFVGGLDEDVKEVTLRAAFLPFGDLKDINMPMNHATGKNRGFGFVEFEEESDAQEAIDNMDGSELFGRTLHVKNARPQQSKSQAAWSSDSWFANLQTQEDEQTAHADAEEASGEQGIVKGPQKQ